MLVVVIGNRQIPLYTLVHLIPLQTFTEYNPTDAAASCIVVWEIMEQVGMKGYLNLIKI